MFVIIKFMNIYWCKKVFLLSLVVWINGRLTQNKGMKNLRFYGLKILGCILWWLFYDDYYDDYFMMIIILWWLLWWLFYDDFVLEMFLKKWYDSSVYYEVSS